MINSVLRSSSSIRRCLLSAFQQTQFVHNTRYLSTNNDDNEEVPSGDPSSDATDGGKHLENETVEDEALESAVLESHQTPETESPSRPYQSDFPVESPLNESQRTSVFIKRRTSFLQSFKPKANEKSEATESDSDDDKETQEIKEDPDVGYAELGGFTSELRTGMLDEPPIKLHPTRFFYAGEQYEPEELHPYGVVKVGRISRRRQSNLRTYTEAEVKAKMNFKNLPLMNNYLSDSGLILSRRETKLPKNLQKKLERSVKTAQALALLPVLDRRAEFKRRPRKPMEREVMR